MKFIRELNTLFVLQHFKLSLRNKSWTLILIKLAIKKDSPKKYCIFQRHGLKLFAGGVLKQHLCFKPFIIAGKSFLSVNRPLRFGSAPLSPC